MHSNGRRTSRFSANYKVTSFQTSFDTMINRAWCSICFTIRSRSFVENIKHKCFWNPLDTEHLRVTCVTFLSGPVWWEETARVSAKSPYWTSSISTRFGLPQPIMPRVSVVSNSYQHKIDYVKEFLISFLNYVSTYWIAVKTSVKRDNGRRWKKLFCKHVVRRPTPLPAERTNGCVQLRSGNRNNSRYFLPFSVVCGQTTIWSHSFDVYVQTMIIIRYRLLVHYLATGRNAMSFAVETNESPSAFLLLQKDCWRNNRFIGFGIKTKRIEIIEVLWRRSWLI